MTTASVVVRLADLPAVQRLVVAAAQIIASVPAKVIREWPEDHRMILNSDLAELLDALEALEAAKS